MVPLAAVLAAVAPEHHRPARELLSILITAGFIQAHPLASSAAQPASARASSAAVQLAPADQPAYLATDAVATAACSPELLQAAKAALEAGPAQALQANITLVWACMQALPGILQGKVILWNVLSWDKIIIISNCTNI